MTPTPTPTIPFGFSVADWNFFTVCAGSIIIVGLLVYLALKWSRGGGRHDK